MRKLLTFLIVLGGDCLWSVLARTRGLRHCLIAGRAVLFLMRRQRAAVLL
jgi:hypothetical protein